MPKGTEVETVAVRARCTNWRQIGLLAHEALARTMGAIGARRGASPAGFPAPAVTPGTLHGVYEFDADVRPSPVADSRWSVDIAPRWNVGGAPNGGYLLSLLAATIGEALPHPHPFTITAHFMRRPRNGEGEIAVDLLPAGRSHSSAEARLYQDGSEMVRALAVFGDLAAERGGPTMITAAPPEMPFPEGLPSSVGFPGLPEIARRFDHRLTPASLGFAFGRREGPPVIEGWTRLVDGREPDPISLLTAADSLPPPILNVAEVGWVPTLEMTVHLRGLPSPGWLAFRFHTRFLVDSYLEEDGELWDSSGKLVALSRQMALALPAAGAAETEGG